ncbi:MAG: methyltransferase domain-containing protein [Rhizobiales bacterium]|nr:methyltransferase domain-containing protein [Hyphomicrobiales bacterium]
MSTQSLINLSTVGTDELRDMPASLFEASLDIMSSDAIARFRQMRELSSHHRTTLERYLLTHPEKRVGGENAAIYAPPRSVPSKKKLKTTVPTAPAKPVAPRKDQFERVGISRLLLQLKAWWRGEDFQFHLKTDAELRRRAHHAALLRKNMRDAFAHSGHEASAAELAKAEIFEMLWGEGYSLPGGTPFALSLVKSVDFSLHRPCLDLTAGLGGGSRSIAKVYQVVVEGVEADKALASTGQMLSVRHGFETAAPIRHCDLAQIDIAEGQYGTILLRECLFAMPKRQELLTRIAGGLAEGGALVLTDYMLSEELDWKNPAGLEDGETDIMAAWSQAEPSPPCPTTPDQYAELLTNLGFQIIQLDDITENYLPMVREGWKNFETCLESVKFPPEKTRTLEREVNLWLARSKALESGRLRVVYIHAVMGGAMVNTEATAHLSKTNVN